jgi:glyceraldehyde 3-phosphate dehydrogenase
VGPLGVDVVLECTGFFTTKEKASRTSGRRQEGDHLGARRQGRRRTVVYGVNHKR